MLSDAVQVLHFVVAMSFLWAGLVEFIRNPPYFDAYGDAVTRNELPEDLFEASVSVAHMFVRLSELVISWREGT